MAIGDEFIGGLSPEGLERLIEAERAARAERERLEKERQEAARAMQEASKKLKDAEDQEKSLGGH